MATDQEQPDQPPTTDVGWGSDRRPLREILLASLKLRAKWKGEAETIAEVKAFLDGLAGRVTDGVANDLVRDALNS